MNLHPIPGNGGAIGAAGKKGGGTGGGGGAGANTSYIGESPKEEVLVSFCCSVLFSASLDTLKHFAIPHFNLNHDFIL